MRKRNIHAVLMCLFGKMSMFAIDADEMTEREYDIIMSWAESPNLMFDYLVELDENGKPDRKKNRSERYWTRTTGLNNVPSTREEFLEQWQLWKRLFVPHLEDNATRLVHSDERTVTARFIFSPSPIPVKCIYIKPYQ